MKPFLIFSLAEYIIMPIILVALLCVLCYYIALILKNRAEIKVMQEAISINDEIANRKYHSEEKYAIYTDLIVFLSGPKFKKEDDLQGTVVDLVLLKQKIKGVELIAGEEVKTILSEYNIVTGEIPKNLTPLKNAMREEFLSD